MKKKLELEMLIPSVPNFILSKDKHSTISIADFTKKELQAIGEAWTRELIKKATRQRRHKKKVSHPLT